MDKWFNIQLNSALLPKEALIDWESKTDSNRAQFLPPLIIESYLDLRNSANASDKLYLADDDNNDWLVVKLGPHKKTKSEIVLERWLVDLADVDPANIENNKQDISAIYQDCAKTLKALIKFISNQPATILRNKLELNNSNPLSVNYRILDPSAKISSKGRIGLSKPIIPYYESASSNGRGTTHILQKEFDAIKTNYGLLSVSVSYRKDCKFHLASAPSPIPNAAGRSPPGYTNFDSTNYNPVAPLFGETATEPSSLGRRNSLLRVRKLSTNSTNSLFSLREDSPKTNSSCTVASPPQTPSSFGPKGAAHPTPPPPPVLGTPAPNNNSSVSLASVPSFHRSNSNVSLAAILRAQRNSFSNTSLNNNGVTASNPSRDIAASVRGTPLLIKRSLSISSAGSAVFDNNDTLSGLIPSGAVAIPSSGNGSNAVVNRYSSSFKSSGDYRRRSLLLLNEPNKRNSFSTARDISPKSSSYDNFGDALAATTASRDINDPLFSDHSLEAFVNILDTNKHQLKANGSSRSKRVNGLIEKRSDIRLEDSLQKFQLMRSSHDALSNNLSNSLLVNLDGPKNIGPQQKQTSSSSKRASSYSGAFTLSTSASSPPSLFIPRRLSQKATETGTAGAAGIPYKNAVNHPPFTAAVQRQLSYLDFHGYEYAGAGSAPEKPLIDDTAYSRTTVMPVNYSTAVNTATLSEGDGGANNNRHRSSSDVERRVGVYIPGSSNTDALLFGAVYSRPPISSFSSSPRTPRSLQHQSNHHHRLSFALDSHSPLFISAKSEAAPTAVAATGNGGRGTGRGATAAGAGAAGVMASSPFMSSPPLIEANVSNVYARIEPFSVSVKNSNKPHIHHHNKDNRNTAVFDGNNIGNPEMVLDSRQPTYSETVGEDLEFEDY